jgi:hypothetical protein
MPADPMVEDPSDAAICALTSAQRRATASMIFRAVALAVLMTLWQRQLPSLRAFQPVLEVMGAIVTLAPYFVSQGRLAARRIALGRVFTDRDDMVAARRVLAPFARGAGARLFDAAGEGRCLLAIACEATGADTEAQRLYATLAREIGSRSEWGVAAAQRLAGPQVVETRKGKT